ncbi:MAG: NUDIX domain-containing protein [Anaerolineae bacterium]|nr:NUDIX domain-containing protein [Anaerolineae bacterium]
MRPGQIRPLALAVIWRGDELLVGEFHNEEQGAFYRLLGGTIEYGEHGQEALRREFHEELGTELADVRYLTTLENIFTYRGQVGHEIVLLYEATMSNQALYEQDVLVVHEEYGAQPARWMNLSTFDDGTPLYPNGLPEYLAERKGAAADSPTR